MIVLMFSQGWVSLIVTYQSYRSGCLLKNIVKCFFGYMCEYSSSFYSNLVIMCSMGGLMKCCWLGSFEIDGLTNASVFTTLNYIIFMYFLKQFLSLCFWKLAEVKELHAHISVLILWSLKSLSHSHRLIWPQMAAANLLQLYISFQNSKINLGNNLEIVLWRNLLLINLLSVN